MIPRKGRPGDGNIGVVNADYDAYRPLVNAMAEVNGLVYHLADRWG